jgi:hypothetical protein
MRKFILISALLLASVSAQASQSRSLILASNDEPKAVETTKPAEAKAEAKTDAKTDANTDAATEVAKPSKSAKKVHAKRREGDEAKARRIAAKYGVYW